jgi:Family of unknown function (DUF6390)
MDGVALCARFSLATSRLQFCGPPGSDALLYRAITEGRDLPAARDALRRFEALLPYLEAIGQKHGRDPFDPAVVEAYWIGNDLLDAFERPDFVELLHRLVRRGLPRSLAERLVAHLPDRPIPHHAFHVSFVGVGNVTGHVATTLANIESCRPRGGEVTAIADGRLTVRSRALRLDDGRLSLGATAAMTVPFDPRLLPGVAEGDAVALHWSTPVLRLDREQRERLEQYTERSLVAASGALASLGVLDPEGRASASADARR